MTSESRLAGKAQLEEEAVVSYTHYLRQIGEGRAENVAAPALATRNWPLPADARLRDVAIAARADEALHRDVNHALANDPAALPPSAEHVVRS